MLVDILLVIALVFYCFAWWLVYKTLKAIKTIGWKPQTCSKSADFETQMLCRHQRKIWVNEVFREAFKIW